CLPNDPIWANYTTKVEEGGYIYGSEYELGWYPTNKLFSFANAKSLHDHNVPCAVDYAPEADPAGYRDDDGVRLYFVQAACGSLPCPPYVNGQELT
ncbi:uncharacterized protein LOC128251410, partial [Octopus bimaculoides]|uniref:uncharacterized protein LOC128251410 n=1 Tax=Octopus bimaculoides TaxID=37653 RepID=UPI0022E80A13